MPRDLFPYFYDRQAITEFLRGTGNASFALTAHVIVVDGKLRLHGGSPRVPAHTVLAWYDTGGSLCAKLLTGADYNPCVRVLAELMNQLGSPERVVTREVEYTDVQEGRQPMLKYFFDGASVSLDEPFVVCGPLTIAAYRAGRK